MKNLVNSAFVPIRFFVHIRLTWLLILVLIIFMWVAACTGAVPILQNDWLSLLSTDNQRLTGGAYVLWHLRLPRIVFSVLIGAALGLSGALTQGLFRNPLADPSLLGITGGAACAVSLTIVFLTESGIAKAITWQEWLLPTSAFVGAIGVCFSLDRIARWLTASSIAGLLLTGIAFNALTAAIIGLCTYLANDTQLRSFSFWTLGSLASANWSLVSIGLALVIFAILSVQRIANTMNALALGEACALHVGVNVQQLRMSVIILVALLCGFSVAWCGMIGFIGLVAPHIVRRLVGGNQRQVVPLSMWVGALLLLCADTIARTIAIPAEIPVGIFTALLGAPFFLALLFGIQKKP